MLDSLFSRFGWYRKLCGGRWYLYRYQLKEENLYATLWTRNKEEPSQYKLFLGLEDYERNSA